MLKIIRRVLRLSGNLSKRIWGSFICGFLESMFGLLPIAAVFLVLIELQNGQPITGQTWGIVIGLIAGGLILRMIFKYLVYRLQSTAGFEFVARERIALGDLLNKSGGESVVLERLGMCRWAFSMITVSETLRRLLQRI